MKHIYITRDIPDIAIELLTKAGFLVTENKTARIPTERSLIKALKAHPYDGVVTLLTDPIKRSIFDACPSLKIVSNYAVGFNNIDVTEAHARNIAVTNTPVSNEHVAEFTLALILALATRLVEGNAYTKAGKYTGWSPALFNGTDIKGATLGLIGSGRIGCSVGERAYKALGMNIVYHDVVENRHLEAGSDAKRMASIEELLKVSDYVSLHVPLLPETTHLINEARLKLMKPSAFLINTARGPVVDEQALEKALKKGLIAGAALDVFEHEPHISRTLRSLPNVILTPHIASSRVSARIEMARIAAQNIIDFFNGKRPQGLVE